MNMFWRSLLRGLGWTLGRDLINLIFRSFR